MIFPKLAYLFHILLVAIQLQPSTQAYIDSQNRPPYGNDYPTRTIAGVDVIDTPIVRAADHFARQYSSDFVYKHVIRSWLFGAMIIANNKTLRNTVDLEVHAVSALLHDLGWDRTPNSPIVSQDKRFEVDGAIAARGFIRNNTHGEHWDERRVQLVWDSIALHTQPSLHDYKELEVMIAGNGILSDFTGPLLGIGDEEYSAVVDEFPNKDLAPGVNETFIWLCQSKPSTTYGKFLCLR